MKILLVILSTILTVIVKGLLAALVECRWSSLDGPKGLRSREACAPYSLLY